MRASRRLTWDAVEAHVQPNQALHQAEGRWDRPCQHRRPNAGRNTIHVLRRKLPLHRSHGPKVYLLRYVSPSIIQLAHHRARPNERNGKRLLIATGGDGNPTSPSPLPPRGIRDDYHSPSHTTSLGLAGWLGRKTKHGKIRNGVQSFRHAKAIIHILRIHFFFHVYCSDDDYDYDCDRVYDYDYDDYDWFCFWLLWLGLWIWSSIWIQIKHDININTWI